MRKVKFLVDFQGRETQNQFFKAGEVAEFPADVALILVQEHRAEFVEVALEAQIEEPAPKKKGK